MKCNIEVQLTKLGRPTTDKISYLLYTISVAAAVVDSTSAEEF